MARTIDILFGKFALQHHFPARNLNFEVDNQEMISVLKYGHNAFLKYGKHRDIHTIADCIAYANYHKWDVSSKVMEHGNDFESNSTLAF
jgi:uncharacterized protein with PIN domain